MHELPVVQGLFQIVMEHAAANDARRVLSVDLAVGALTDLVDEWIERYFAMLAEGTIAAGARLNIKRPPGRMRCVDCGTEREFERGATGQPCPQCHGTRVELIAGREYTVVSIAVE